MTVPVRRPSLTFDFEDDRSLPWKERLHLAWRVLWAVVLTLPEFFLSLLRLIHLLPPYMPMHVVRKVVLVTGAGQGLGRELAMAFGRRGAVVVCVDVNATTVAATAARLRNNLAVGHAYACDVANRDRVMALADRVRREVGPVDILVNNAAVLDLGEARGGADPAARTEHMARANLLSHFWTLQAFLPDMLNRGAGHIVAMSSAAALFGLGDTIAYSACKAGVAGLMAALSDHLRMIRQDNIKTTIVFPYFVRTPHIESSATLRLPAMRVRATAEAIVDGVQMELDWFTVPRTLAVAHYILRMLPKSLTEKIRDIFYVHIKTSTREFPETMAFAMKKCRAGSLPIIPQNLQ